MQEKKRKKSEKLFLSYWKLTEHVSNLSRQDGQAVTLFYISYTSDTNNKKKYVLFISDCTVLFVDCRDKINM